MSYYARLVARDGFFFDVTQEREPEYIQAGSASVEDGVARASREFRVTAEVVPTAEIDEDGIVRVVVRRIYREQ